MKLFTIFHLSATESSINQSRRARLTSSTRRTRTSRCNLEATPSKEYPIHEPLLADKSLTMSHNFPNPFVNTDTITICFGDRYRCIARPASYRALQREGREAFPDMSAAHSVVVVLFQVAELPNCWLELSPDAYAVVRGGAVLYFNAQHPVTKEYILPLPGQQLDPLDINTVYQGSPQAPASSSESQRTTPNDGTVHRQSKTRAPGAPPTTCAEDDIYGATPRPGTAPAPGAKQARPPPTTTNTARPPLDPRDPFISRGDRSTASAFADLRGRGGSYVYGSGSGWGASSSQRPGQSAWPAPGQKPKCQDEWLDWPEDGVPVEYADEHTAHHDRPPVLGVDGSVGRAWVEGLWQDGGAYAHGKTAAPVGPSLYVSNEQQQHQHHVRPAASWDNEVQSVGWGMGRMSLAPSATENGWCGAPGAGLVDAKRGWGPRSTSQAPMASVYNDGYRGTSTRGDGQDFSASVHGPAAQGLGPPPGFSCGFATHQNGYVPRNGGHQQPQWYPAPGPQPQQQQYYHGVGYNANFGRNQQYGGGWAPIWPRDCDISSQQNGAKGGQYQPQYQHQHPPQYGAQRHPHPAANMMTMNGPPPRFNLASVRTSSDFAPQPYHLDPFMMRPARPFPPPPPSSTGSSHFHPSQYATGSPRRSRTKARLAAAWAAGKRRREQARADGIAAAVAGGRGDGQKKKKKMAGQEGRHHARLEEDLQQAQEGGQGGGGESRTGNSSASEYHSAVAEYLEDVEHLEDVAYAEAALERGSGDEKHVQRHRHHASEYNNNNSRVAHHQKASTSDRVPDDEKNLSEYDTQHDLIHFLLEEQEGCDASEPTEEEHDAAAPGPSRTRSAEFWFEPPLPPPATARKEAPATSSTTKRASASKKASKKNVDGCQHVTTTTAASGQAREEKEKQQQQCTYQHQCRCDHCTSERCCIHYIRRGTQDEEDFEVGTEVGGQGWCACDKGCPEHHHERWS